MGAAWGVLCALTCPSRSFSSESVTPTALGFRVAPPVQEPSLDGTWRHPGAPLLPGPPLGGCGMLCVSPQRTCGHLHSGVQGFGSVLLCFLGDVNPAVIMVHEPFGWTCHRKPLVPAQPPLWPTPDLSVIKGGFSFRPFVGRTPG